MYPKGSIPDFEKTARAPHIIPQPQSFELGDKYVPLCEYRLQSLTKLDKINNLYQKTFPLNTDAQKKITLRKTENLREEEYNLDIAEDRILVEAADEKGFFYALQTMKQLELGGVIACAKIKDSPKLKMRGFHFNLGSARMIGFDDVINILQMMAKFKMNTLLLEYSDKFPFQKHSKISSVAAFSKEQTEQIEQLAKANYIDIIPLVQSLGHVRHVLRNSQYRHLLECEVENLGHEQFCPLKTESFELFKEITLEIMSAHPESKYLHIGADESRSLGVCPECASFVETSSKGKLYAIYINKVIAWVKKQGLIPIIWDDMLSHYPEALEMLDKDAIIMYWDYWTTNKKSPIIVARADGYGLVHDRRWDNEWNIELQEPEKTVVEKFSHGIDPENDLSEEYKQYFKNYIGDEFPKYFNAFPSVELFKDKGFSVIGAPTTLGNCIDETFGLPNYNRFLGNIKEFTNKCIEEDLPGLVTTAWYNFPSEILDFGIMATAHLTWYGIK